MFREEIIAWTYDALRKTGYFDLRVLRNMQHHQAACKIAKALFDSLPAVERDDIKFRYLDLIGA